MKPILSSAFCLLPSAFYFLLMPRPRRVRLFVLTLEDAAQMRAAIDRAVRNRRAADGAPVLHDLLRSLLEHAQGHAHDEQEESDEHRVAEHVDRHVLRDRRSLEALL